jgi:hypothetical protein
MSIGAVAARRIDFPKAVRQRRCSSSCILYPSMRIRLASSCVDPLFDTIWETGAQGAYHLAISLSIGAIAACPHGLDTLRSTYIAHYTARGALSATEKGRYPATSCCSTSHHTGLLEALKPWSSTGPVTQDSSQSTSPLRVGAPA